MSISNMNTNNGELLMLTAAQAGDIDLLYTVIQDDPSILDRIESMPFVETPLHIAASMGHLQFATEIMMLKPSFAWKLNRQGFSPVHLAMQNGQSSMVFRFVSINKELVRVQGRECLTPLHFASQIGEVEFLAYFLFHCPESIEYLTVRFETALHIAAKNEQFEALQVLVTWLETNEKRGARKLEFKILNQMDEAGNTILHISALRSKQQTQLLVKTWMNLKKKNLENKTALDIATSSEIEQVLSSAGVKPGSQVTDAPTYAHKLRYKTRTMDKVLFYISRYRSNISEEQRNTWLIVATLVATATFQSALSPPGGVYQANASDNYVNITSTNSTISTLGNVGKSVLKEDYYIVYSLINMLSFFLSAIAIFILIPSGIVGLLVTGPVAFFVLCYVLSMAKTSPTHATTNFVNIISFSTLFVSLSYCAILLYTRGRRLILNLSTKALVQ